MRRALMLLVTATLCLSACSGGPSSATQTPTRTADIKRSTLDIAYSAFVDEDVHHITSKRALEAALEAARVEARAQGSKVEVRTPSFQDTDETQLSDFKLFAEAVNQLALGVQLAGGQYSAERLADAAIGAMIKASPDCHTQYLSASAGVISSSTATLTGTSAMIPAEGTSLGGPDEAGLTGKILSGGIAYLTWRDFTFGGTYKIDAALRAMLAKALALKENKRATIVGEKTLGCLGAEAPNPLPGGASLHVAVQEFVGGVTGAKYNNVGIPPDVRADDATAVGKAIEILKQKLAGGG